MNFDDMPWLVTSGEQTYGPFTKQAATDYAAHLQGEGKQAVAWAAQVPNPAKLIEVPA